MTTASDISPRFRPAIGLDRPSLEDRRILIADDDLRLAFRLEQAVMEAGGEVVGPAVTVSDALILLNKEKVDVAILDVMLHRELATRVAEALSDRGIPFLFLTDGPLPWDLKSRYPEAPVYEKPMSFDGLIEDVAELATRAADASAVGEHCGLDHRPAA